MRCGGKMGYQQLLPSIADVHCGDCCQGLGTLGRVYRSFTGSGLRVHRITLGSLWRLFNEYNVPVCRHCVVFTRPSSDVCVECLTWTLFAVQLGRAYAVYGCCCELPMGLSDPSGCKSIYSHHQAEFANGEWWPLHAPLHVHACEWQRLSLVVGT